MPIVCVTLTFPYITIPRLHTNSHAHHVCDCHVSHPHAHYVCDCHVSLHYKTVTSPYITTPIWLHYNQILQQNSHVHYARDCHVSLHYNPYMTALQSLLYSQSHMHIMCVTVTSPCITSHTWYHSFRCEMTHNWCELCIGEMTHFQCKARLSGYMYHNWCDSFVGVHIWGGYGQ